VLPKTDRIADQVRLVRDQAREFAGRDIGIAMTELNTSYGRNTQPGALFAADAYATLLANGVFTVDWWNVHNGVERASTVEGQPDFHDFGLLSSGGCTADGTVCQPAMNTPFAPYHALSMVSRAFRPGSQLIGASTSDSQVVAHAARHTDGGLAVLLLNRDPSAARTVEVGYAGYSPAAAAQVLTYGNGDTAITTTPGTADAVTLPPYSLTTLLLRPSTSTTPPKAPGRPAATTVTDRTATLTWPAAAPGVKYEVQRQFGTTSETWGETTATTFTARNLTPSTRYTVNVVARDSAGRVSWASPPVTFQTTSPATSTCQVRYAETTNWGNGFVADVAITNTGTQPIDSWTLTFPWPTTWQHADSGWNANWSQSGTLVTATNVEGNRVLAPGASTTAGFVGSYGGPDVRPTSFTLNGIRCATT
jgi:hypothetical protein